MLGEEEYNELQLDEQGEVLTHVYSKLNSIRAVENMHSDLGGSSGGKRHSGEIKSFDPNYQQALAWERLMKGSYNKNDILLLNHELFNIREVEH
ncbi:hypothetical protein SAMN05428961_10490 [Paenibacillus sp. OK060]|uniref:hypothetical protein n=1 Tax=unclassified Paenibacillus TaxID=185978 RepID=UPI000889B408|nr:MULTISPECIES: hypothetical protein [unclassified Paenibacillus]SDL15347.1 hypothetical protein SAMN05428961_10490 [Paenibacillus sp. OK060]